MTSPTTVLAPSFVTATELVPTTYSGPCPSVVGNGVGVGAPVGAGVGVAASVGATVGAGEVVAAAPQAAAPRLTMASARIRRAVDGMSICLLPMVRGGAGVDDSVEFE